MKSSTSDGSSMLSLRYPCHLVAAVALAMAVTGVPTLAADTATIGGPGGGSFRLVCAQGMFLVGVTGRAGDWLDQVAPVCATIDAAGRWKGVLRTGPATGGSGGGSFTTMCQEDSVVVGFSGYSLEYVFNIGLSCRHVGPKGAERRTALPRLVGGALDIGSSAGFDCATDHAANGIIGRSGLYVDRFGLACAGFIGSVPVPAAPRPPVGDRVMANAPIKGPVSFFRWSSRTFPAPNGGLLVFTIMPDGNPACASYDGGNCLWGLSLDQIDTARLIPLVCGEMHRVLWGTTGFEDPKHWCSLARTRP